MNAMMPGAQIEKELAALDQRLHEETLDQPTESAGQEYGQWLREQRGIFQVKLTQYVGLYELARDLKRTWRHEVFRGLTPPDADKDATLRRLFATLLRRLARPCLSERPILRIMPFLSMTTVGPFSTVAEETFGRNWLIGRRQVYPFPPPCARAQSYSPQALARMREILSGKD